MFPIYFLLSSVLDTITKWKPLSGFAKNLSFHFSVIFIHSLFTRALIFPIGTALHYAFEGLFSFYVHIIQFSSSSDHSVYNIFLVSRLCLLVRARALVLPRGTSGKEPTCQHRKHKRYEFSPRAGKIPWKRAWQPTPGFLPGESHGQGSLVGCSPWGRKESDTTEVT